MKILAIESSTEVLSVAVYHDGEIHWREAPPGERPGDHLLGLIDAVLYDARISRLELGAIAFGRGPGAFTGVRMAVAAAQGIAYGLDIPAVPVSSLAALAQEAFAHGAAPPLLSLLDARMGEVYAGGFDVDRDGLVIARDAERLCRPEQIELPGDEVWSAFGPGQRAYHDLLAAQLGHRLDPFAPMVWPSARAIARLAARALRAEPSAGVSAAAAQPVYLRDKVAATEAERRAREP
jgi:tRNA threonylcarbamoyladenosine biosynthesis protein TsaB